MPSLASLHQRALFPRVSGEREQVPRRRHGGKIERHTGAMQIHRRLQHAIRVRGHDGPKRLRGLCVRARRDIPESRARAPDAHSFPAKRPHRNPPALRPPARNCTGCAHAAAPVFGTARLAGAAVACDGAEKRDGVRLRFQVGERASNVSPPAASADDETDDQPSRAARTRPALPTRRAIASSEKRGPRG